MMCSTGPTPNPPAETRIVNASSARPCFRRIARASFGSAKTGSIGMPETVTLLVGHAQRLQVDLRLLERDEVMLGAVAEPHGVDVEVGDDHGVHESGPSPAASATR